MRSYLLDRGWLFSGIPGFSDATLNNEGEQVQKPRATKTKDAITEYKTIFFLKKSFLIQIQRCDSNHC